MCMLVRKINMCSSGVSRERHMQPRGMQDGPVAYG